ncbi:hypothetical protein CP533_1204 [Ophiocordyceps camponoti-saundersi (nom. inval.)]|nr:hypothetical protein CP533_1204 [Ophiocordyceps camponoti-saundersi (nom. inval.)]
MTYIPSGTYIPSDPASIISELPSKPTPGFDPWTQTVGFYGADGKTIIGVPLTAVDNFSDETASMAISAGAQVGACIITLAALLILTPAAKLRRTMAILQIIALVMVLARGGFQCSDAFGPPVHFYVWWANDYSAMSRQILYKTVASHVVTMFVNIAVEAALMNQAWTMVTLWPALVRKALIVASAFVAVVLVTLRVIFAVMLSRADLLGYPRSSLSWIMTSTLIANTVSIFWFCLVFNVKLVIHLVSNRGLLPKARKLSSMEVLVMTNGLLMVIPVVFAGLEWGHFRNFEPAFITNSSVAIILPIGTLAAQRAGTFPTIPRYTDQTAVPESASSASQRFRAGLGSFGKPSLSNSSASPCETAQTGLQNRVDDAFDLELRRIDTGAFSLDLKMGQRDEQV